MNVFITGGLTGIGLEVAKIMMSDGHKVGICSFQNETEILDLIPNGAEYYQADVTDRTAMNRVVTEFAIKNGSLDVIYANAGVNHPKQAVPDWDQALKVVDINIKGVMHTFEPALKIMKEQKSGHLVTVASVCAFAGLPGMSVYGGSKAFVKSFSESMAVDLDSYGIKVTTVAPGFVLTPLTENSANKMPFVIDQAQAGREVVKAIYQTKTLYVFPTVQRYIAMFLYYLPRFLYRFMMRRDPTGLRSGK